MTDTDVANKNPRRQRRIGINELADTIRGVCAWFINNLGGDDAQALADEIVDMLIAVLRRELPQRSRLEWAIALGDLRQQVAELLAFELAIAATDGDDLAEQVVRELIDDGR